MKVKDPYIQDPASEDEFLRGSYGMNRTNDKNNESVYGKFCMSVKCEGINCRVVVKHSTLTVGGLVT